MRVDEIRQEVRVEAPIERVWEALTSAEHLSKWFGDTAELDLRAGGHASFGWSEFNDSVAAIIEVVQRPTRFSFRWESLRSTPVEEASTLVEFELTEEGSTTVVRLIESGFAALPETVYSKRFTENASGWSTELADLAEYLTGAGSVA
ncbi:MAG: SRPBCC domain-containing protein [Acidimicrobiia bacterium]